MTASTIRRGYVQTSRGQLHYRRSGAGAPILMMQILPFSNAIFEPLMGVMDAAGYDCLAMDLMGYGQSDRRTATWTVEEQAQCLAEALANLDFRPACVVGGHFTAMVATEFAVCNPDRLDRLLLDGVPLWPREVAAQRLAAPQSPAVWSQGGDEIKALWTSAIGLLKKFDPSLTLTAETTSLVAEAFFGFTGTVLAPGSTEAIFRYNLEGRLREITTPTLVVASPTDSLRDRHDKAMALIPGACEHVFTDVHPLYALGRSVRVAEYAKVIGDFVEGQGRG